MATIPKVRLKFVQRLRELRKKRRLTQERMAEIAGIDVRYYQRLESNKPGSIKIDTLDKLAKALEVSISKLLQFKD